MADWTGKDRLRMTIDEARALGGSRDARRRVR
jgi:hypothetical protein